MRRKGLRIKQGTNDIYSTIAIGGLGTALDMWHLLHVLDRLESEHRGYKMKNAELFRNGQSKPEVLEETWVEQFPALAGFTVPG